jgi:hypothetical protein
LNSTLACALECAGEAILFLDGLLVAEREEPALWRPNGAGAFPPMSNDRDVL